MDRLRQFLESVRDNREAEGNFLGLLNVVIGRRISLADGTPVSAACSWRELAALLKKIRWPREAVCELGLTPSQLPPRDRQRYWYSAIAQASVDSAAAAQAGNTLAAKLGALGYQVGPQPRTETLPKDKRGHAS
jgi:hypothetical protein